MRVALVCPFGLRQKGTVLARVLPAGRALARCGHQVTVLIPPWDSPADAGREEREGGLAVRHLPLRGAGRWGWGELAARLATEAWRWGPDVVHVFKPKGFAGLAQGWVWARRGVARGSGPVLVLDSDDWEGPGGWNDRAGYPPWARPLFAWQERWGLRHADRVTVVSQALGEMAAGLGVDALRVRRVPNALERAHPALQAQPWQPGEGDGTPTLLLYSRFWEFDHWLLARRLRLLSERLGGLRLLLAGRGAAQDEGSLAEALAAEGVAPAARWLGWVEGPRLAGVAAGAWAALVPLRDDLVNRARFPVKALDLMALGLPVAADAVGELPDALGRGSCGLLLPADDAAWAEEMEMLLRGAERRAELGRRARQRVLERYLWEGQVANLEAAYQPLR